MFPEKFGPDKRDDHPKRTFDFIQHKKFSISITKMLRNLEKVRVNERGFAFALFDDAYFKHFWPVFTRHIDFPSFGIVCDTIQDFTIAFARSDQITGIDERNDSS